MSAQDNNGQSKVKGDHNEDGHADNGRGPAKELLNDGGFEQAKVGAKTWSHQKTVGGWQSDTEVEVWGKDFYGIKATEGDKFAELDFDRKASNIFQDVATVAATEYAFSFDSMKRPDSKDGSDTVLVFWNGEQVGKVEPGKEWSKAVFKVTGTGGTDRIEFREDSGDNDSYGGLIDNASLKSTGRVESENAEKAAADKAAADKAAADKAAADKAAADKAAADKAAADKAAADKAAADKAAADKAAADKAAADKAAADKAAADKAAADKAAADKAAADKAASDKAAADKAASDKAAADKAAADKAAADKAASDKAAADKAASDKAAADKAAADKAAADKAAADAAHEHDHSDLHIGDGAKNALTGDDHDSVIFGEGGKDVLAGRGGDDRMHGGGGDDVMTGDAGNDTMFGSATVGGKVDMSNFRISEDATAKVTFNYESAGYKNALGVYKIAADGSISGVQVLFANASLQGSGGNLISGVSSVDVGVKAGEKLGFFVVPNGFSQRGMADLLSDKSASFKFVGADGKAGNVNGGAELKLVQVNSNGVETIVKSQYGNSIFHSVDDGSKGLNGDGMKHVVGTVNNLDGTVKVGFEDLKWGGDKDFDDSVFTVTLGTTNTALLAKEQTKPGRQSDNDDMKGGTGADKMFGMADNDVMDGGGGDDQMWGNSGNDKMTGGAGNDVLSGGKGDDIIAGGAGSDKLAGNSGNDRLVADAGNDTYDGGSGFDTLDFSGARNGVSVDLSKHTAMGFGVDTMKGVEGLVGTAFADSLAGDKQANVIAAGAGDDTIRSLGGADSLSGGAGRDTFVWFGKDVVDKAGTHLGVDHVTDFQAGDRLDLRNLLKGQKFSSSNDVVHVTDGSKGATVSVKMGDHFVDVVTLDGLHASDLLSSGLILS